MSDHPFDLDARRAALESAGFVVVELLPDGFVAWRRRWHWDLFSRLTTLVRVRRVKQVDLPALLPAEREMESLFRRHDTGRIPRAFQHGWVLVDTWLADGAAPEAIRHARATVGKGLGRSYHPVILTDEGVAMVEKPFFGGAFWPKTRHVIDAAAFGRTGPEPTSVAGLMIALFFTVPSVLIVSLFGCGLPILIWLLLAWTEKPAVAVEDPRASLDGWPA